MKTILLCGGGSLGPVTPLVAIGRQMLRLSGLRPKIEHFPRSGTHLAFGDARAQTVLVSSSTRFSDAISNPQLRIVWIGTPTGPEQRVIAREGWEFLSIPVAKFPGLHLGRLFAWPWKYWKAHQSASRILDRTEPVAVFGVGGYMQVPVMRDAFSRNIPCAIHQLDAEPGLSNRIVASQCEIITTSFVYPKPPFGPRVSSDQVATPCRFMGRDLPSRREACAFFGLDSARPILFVTGGGTGALAVNTMIQELESRLLERAQLIHLTGIGKELLTRDREGLVRSAIFDETEMLHALIAADVVIARGGIGTLSELAYLQKTAIVIPMPGSHQERNVEAVQGGIILFAQQNGSSALWTQIQEVLDAPQEFASRGRKLHQLLPTDDGSLLAKKWLDLF